MIFRVDKWAVECHISRKIWQDSHSQVQLNLDMYFCFTTQHREFHKSAFSMWDRERERVTKRDRDTQRDGERETERHTCLALEQNPAYAIRRHNGERHLIHKGLNVTWGWELLLKLSSTCCCCSVAKSRLTLGDPMNEPARLLCPWAFPGKNTGVGGHPLLQEIFPD